ncbi:hypothetical protein GGE09_003543 [Roseobacter sp. N2S]|nr:hypothetical protein [Roseobacter sp. N2S]
MSSLILIPRWIHQSGGIAPDTERLHRPKGYSTILVNKDTLEVIGLIGLVEWCPHTDSNRGPTDYKLMLNCLFSMAWKIKKVG